MKQLTLPGLKLTQNILQLKASTSAELPAPGTYEGNIVINTSSAEAQIDLNGKYRSLGWLSLGDVMTGGIALEPNMIYPVAATAPFTQQLPADSAAGVKYAFFDSVGTWEKFNFSLSCTDGIDGRTNDFVCQNSRDMVLFMSLGPGNGYACLSQGYKNEDYNILMSESVSKSLRQSNKQKFAASGFVYPGKHYLNQAAAINEGLWVKDSAVATPNTFYMGRGVTDQQGNSKTDMPLFNANGIIINMANINGDEYENHLLLPPEPTGTVTFQPDGTTVDFAVDVDPKYGDIASTEHEARRRAFEGLVVNGDFRNGVTGWSNLTSVTDNLATISTPAGVNTRAWQAITVKENTDYVANVYLHENSTIPADIYISATNESSGIIVHTGDLTVNKTHKLYFNSGSNTTVYILAYAIGTYGQAGDIVITGCSLWEEGAGVSVERIDVVGVNIWLEEISDGEVFPTSIQNKNSEVLPGIPMVLSTRPKSYFQTYEGQYSDPEAQNTEFYCWDWDALTAAQKRQVATYLGESFFIGGTGYKVQARVRAMSIAGIGNGDWKETFPAGVGHLEHPKPINIRPQGQLNAPLPPGTGYPVFASTDALGNPLPEKALFTATLDIDTPYSAAAYNGECYFFTIASVPRLNRSIFHPALNPLGTAKVLNNNRDAAVIYVDATAQPIRTQLDCFDLPSTTGGYPYPDGKIAPDTGTLAFPSSGRADGKLSDVVYASGEGGVSDERLKYGAWEASSIEKASVVRIEVFRGEYRGREFLYFTEFCEVVEINPDGLGADSYRLDRPLPYWKCNNRENTHPFDHLSPLLFYRPSTQTFFRSASYGESFFVDGKNIGRHDGSTGGVMPEVGDILLSTSAVDPMSGVRPTNINSLPISNPQSSILNVYIGITSDITLEGEMLQTDICGSPDLIIQNTIFKEGWYGGWIPTVMDGATFPILTRPFRGNISEGLYDAGTWTISTPAVSSENNHVLVTPSASQLIVFAYTTPARVTFPQYLPDIPSVLYNESGIGPVYATMSSYRTYGKELVDSVFAIVTKEAGNVQPVYGTALLTNFSLNEYDKIFQSISYTHKYTPITLANPVNGDRAMKFIMYQNMDDHGRCSLSLVCDEMIFSNASWGDEGVIRLSSGGFYTDGNGELCRTAVHGIRPYGWVSN